jgi:hypothetical protein
MMQGLFSSRRTHILLAISLIVLERAGARMFGWDVLPGLGADAGLLLLWGIGHCDTMDGPLVALAIKALEEKNVNLVLPWVRPEDEHEVRHAFEHAQVVRDLGPQALALADRHFLETLVRIHRAGEGAPFTGLKPAGLDLGPAVPAADRALKSGSVDALVKLLANAVSEGVRSRFLAATQSQNFDPNDVTAGRKYVEAYVPYVHYVEKMWQAATSAASHSQCGEHEPPSSPSEHASHHH